MNIVKLFEYTNFKNERCVISYDNDNECVYYFNYHRNSSTMDSDLKNMMDNAINYVSRYIDELLYFDVESYESVMETINLLIESCDSKFYINCYNDLKSLINEYMESEVL